MSRFIVTCIGLMMTSHVFAYGVVTGKVINVRVDASGFGMVIFDQPVTGDYATCRHSAYTNALSFNANNAGGRAVLAMALAAKSTGSIVSAIGGTTCGNYGGAFVEDWSYGVVQ